MVRNKGVRCGSLLRMILNSRPMTNQNAGESMSVLTDGFAISPTPTLLLYHHSPLSFIQFLVSPFKNRPMRVQDSPEVVMSQ